MTSIRQPNQTQNAPPQSDTRDHSPNGGKCLRAVIEASVDCVITIDAESTILEFNAAAERTFGYRRDEVVGRPLMQTIIPPSLRDARQTGMAALLKGGTGKLLGKRVEMRAMRFDGSEFPVELTVTQIPGQTPPIFTAYLRDITARVQVEEASNAQTLRYKTLMELSTDSIYVLDEKGDLQEANAAFLNRRGYTAADVKGLNLADWDAQWSREQLQERLRKLVGGGAVFETRHRCKDGSVFDVEVCATSVRIGRDQLFLCVTRDITQRKQAEQALRESEERFRELAENIDAVVWLSDPLHKEVFYISPAYERIWGRTRASLYAAPRSWTEALHPDDREWVLKLRADDHIHEMPDLTYRIIRSDGSLRWIHSREFPVKGADGKIMRVAGIVEDITERKRVEEALRARERDLAEAQRVAKIGSWRFDPRTDLVTWSDELYRIFEIAKSDLNNYRSFLNRVHSEDKELVFQTSVRARECGKEFDIEYRIFSQSGRVKIIRELGFVSKDDQGNVKQLFGVAQDITERKRVELALDERLRFETLLTELSAAFANLPTTTVDQEIDKWLRNLVEFLDLDRAILDQVGEDGRTLSRSHSHTVRGIDVFPLEVSTNDQAPWITEQLLRGNTVKWSRIPDDIPEQAWKEKEFAGRIGAKSVLSIPVCIGGSVICAVSFTSLRTYRDWSDEMVARLRLVGEIFANAIARKRVEEALFRREAELNEAQRLASIGSWEWDILTDGLTYSDELRRIYGFEREDRNSPNKAFLEAIHSDDRARRNAAIRAALAGGPAYNVEFRIIRPDKSVRFVHSRGQLICDEAGKPVRMIGMAQDITERKQAARELEKANHRLRLLSRRLFEVQEEERRHLARELHDEIGQELTAAKINLQSVTTNGDGTTSARLQETTAILDRLLGQVRQISIDLRPSMLDDLGLVPALRSLVDQQGRRASVAVRFSAKNVPENLDPEIQITCFRMAQEAITNAVRHAHATRVDVDLRCKDGELRVLVRDNGIGFDVEATRAQAAGLGLIGIKERAALLSGCAKITSSQNQGTTIEVSLPVKLPSKRSSSHLAK